MNFGRINLFKKWIKLILAFPSHIRILFKLLFLKDSAAVLIGSPVHANLGDHLIAVKSIELIKAMGYDNVIDIPEFFYQVYRGLIYVKQGIDIFIVGGGWMGDLYDDELVIEDIIKRFKTHRIIILPQTIYFHGTERYSSKDKLEELLSMHTNVIICVRDKDSYDLLINDFHIDAKRCYFLPDVALYGKDCVKAVEEEQNGIIVSLRSDRESLGDYRNKVINRLIELNCPYVESGTVLDKKFITYRHRGKYIKEKITEYSRANMIITDRLHTMIFSVWSKTVCYILDNKTHKVRNTFFDWLRNDPNIHFIADIESFMDIELLNVIKAPLLYKEFYLNVNDLYKDLQKGIKK